MKVKSKLSVNTDSKIKSAAIKGFFIYNLKLLWSYCKVNLISMITTTTITTVSVASVGYTVHNNIINDKNQEIIKLQEEVIELKDEIKVIPEVIEPTSNKKDIIHIITTFDGDKIEGVLVSQNKESITYRLSTGILKSIKREEILSDEIKQ